MKRNPLFDSSLRLALVAGILLGPVAVADENVVAEELRSAARIVVALSGNETESETAVAELETESDAAVRDALEAVTVDNKIELDLRLADPKSTLLVAAR